MSNFALAPESAARYRAITHHSLHVVHNRKDCACGKQITAKQLTQYGKCAKCHNPGRPRTTSSRSAPSFVAPSSWTKARTA